MIWFWLGVGLAAVAVWLACWALGWPWARLSAPQARAQPLWWPWVAALAPWCAPFVTWAMRRWLQQWGPRAGLASVWLPERWLAAQLLLAALGGLLAGASAWMLEASVRVALVLVVAAGCLGYCLPGQSLRRKAAVRRQQMLRELPFMLDLMTLCVEAGLSLSAALRQVAEHAPAGPLRQSLREAAALERTGVERAHWLERWAQWADLPGVRNLVLALAQADRLGMSLGPLLRAQAERQRSERFLRAETLALQAPVKMLFPMVVCIFPCTFLVIGFPIAVKLLDAGF
ncbi:type II secretion system F family protein [Castellaniella caeni]|uniref:type II secretion system F family protein n=1 Tax=Castellaniella caeni TaxID=266123 RepID=UPI00082EBA36|nr:type II secretion system F family protein [Castellaniella caeni]